MATTQPQNRYLLLCAEEEKEEALPEPNKMTSSGLLTSVSVSDNLVKNRLHEGGISAPHPLVGHVLTAQHHGAQLAFAFWCYWILALLLIQLTIKYF